MPKEVVAVIVYFSAMTELRLTNCSWICVTIAVIELITPGCAVDSL